MLQRLFRYCALFFLLLRLPIFGEESLPLCTYFEYSSDELKSLKTQKSDLIFKKEDLRKWDQQVDKAFKDEAASLTALRLYTYLYVAQMEAAKLSYNTHGKLIGSLDPISYRMISFFIDDYKKPSEFKEDNYSNMLAKIISKKIQDRIEKEDARQAKFKVPKEMESHYFVGLTIADWIPWYTVPATAYWPLPPPTPNDPEWKKQIKEIRAQQKQMITEKKETIFLWAGMKDPDKSDWRIIANTYLFSHDVPLFKMLQVRSVLMTGLYDALIVSFGAKYHYLVQRPTMYDPTLHHEIPVPKHPSYPSNHSVISSLSATILSYFFPSESDNWHELENDAGSSRIWGGIHYPLDDRAGRQAGQKVAKNLLEKVFESSSTKCTELVSPASTSAYTNLEK